MPVRTTASSRNCMMMSIRLAPIAFRIPISFVRSVTETSMMFITPMPPTSSPMELRTTITRNVMEVIWRNCSTISSAVDRAKLSGLCTGYMTVDPQNGPNLVHRLGSILSWRQNDQREVVRVRIRLSHGEIGHYHAVI